MLLMAKAWLAITLVLALWRDALGLGVRCVAEGSYSVWRPCRCRLGFYGELCQHDLHQLHTGPCLHGFLSELWPSLSRGRCVCHELYRGRWCQLPVCEQGSLEGLRCRCAAGWRGRHCAERRCFAGRFYSAERDECVCPTSHVCEHLPSQLDSHTPVQPDADEETLQERELSFDQDLHLSVALALLLSALLLLAVLLRLWERRRRRDDGEVMEDCQGQRLALTQASRLLVPPSPLLPKLPLPLPPPEATPRLPDESK